MEREQVISKIDHTQLKAFASWEDIKTLVEQAIEKKTATVCIPPCYVKRVQEKYQNQICICTVVGFPLGYQATQIKLAEAKLAIEEGAEEIDMVINLTDVKNQRWQEVAEEIRLMRALVGDLCLKVIIETCYLQDEEKIKLCQILTKEKVDYIKTSTGFGTQGATLVDIELFKKHIGDQMKIKAAGGIRTYKEAKTYVEAGCARVGSSLAALDEGN